MRANVANFRKGPSRNHDVVFVADRYYPVEVLQSKNGWVKVRDFEGDEAWVAKWLLATTKTVVVTVNLANLRKAPNTDAEIVHQAERGAVFKVAKLEGEWVEVVHEDGDAGWMHRKLVWGLESKERARSHKSPPRKGSTEKPVSGSKAKDDKPAKPRGAKGK